jgi:hypothetical protein
MSAVDFGRASLLGALLLGLAGCAGVPQTGSDAPSAWHIVQRQPSADMGVPQASAGRLGERVRLGEVTIADDAEDSADSAALEDLRTAVAEQLRLGLGAADDAAITMNVRLQQAVPVSPVANAITGALLFVPLDTGSIVVETELTAANGAPIAIRRERLRGDYLDIGTSLSRWGRLRNALQKWAQRCLEESAPPIDSWSIPSSNIS